jgi:hypothetical protein
MYMIVKCGGIVGGGGTIKQFLLMILFAVAHNLKLKNV